MLDARTRKGKPRFALQLRQAAQSLHAHRGALGARYRRLRSRQEAPKALTAMAQCLTRIIYQLVSERRAYDASIFAALEAEHDQRQRRRLQRQVTNLGHTLIPAASIESFTHPFLHLYFPTRAPAVKNWLRVLSIE